MKRKINLILILALLINLLPMQLAHAYNAMYILDEQSVVITENGDYYIYCTEKTSNTIFVANNLHDVSLTLENLHIRHSSEHSIAPVDIGENSNVDIEFLGEKKQSINIPFISNNKTFIQKAGVYFESIFYNWYFYLITYGLILIYLIKYQDRFKLKIKYPIFLILFLATFLRLSHIDFIPLWNDELYTLTYISDMGEGLNLKRAFLDVGNPP